MSVFLAMEMTRKTKIRITDILDFFSEDREILFRFGVLSFYESECWTDDGYDAQLTLCDPLTSRQYQFFVEARISSVPRVVRSAAQQASDFTATDEKCYPMILVPYLSEKRLQELERDGVSGVDLCGNGVITISEQLTVFRSGNKNLYPESRPMNNPFRGRSAMVGRMLLNKSRWDSLNSLKEGIDMAGTNLSISQISKTVQALQEELIVSKKKGCISLTDPLRLLDELARNWSTSKSVHKKYYKLTKNLPALATSLNQSKLAWSVIGADSLGEYMPFSEQGPIKIAVSSLARAERSLPISSEEIPNFADIALIETTEEGFFFNNKQDKDGIRRADVLQSWLELQNGDARQKEIAGDLKKILLSRLQ